MECPLRLLEDGVCAFVSPAALATHCDRTYINKHHYCSTERDESNFLVVFIRKQGKHVSIDLDTIPMGFKPVVIERWNIIEEAYLPLNMMLHTACN